MLPFPLCVKNAAMLSCAGGEQEARSRKQEE